MMEEMMKKMAKQMFNISHIYLKKEDGINSNEELEKFAAQNNLKGTGVEDDPFIIDENVKVPNIYYFLKVNKYVTIKNLEFEILELRECENFGIVGCSIKTYNLSRSKHIQSRENKITELFLLSSNNCEFNNGSINSVHDMMSFGNIFNGVKLSEKERERIIADPLKSPSANKFFIFALILLVISIITTSYVLKDSYLMLPLLFSEIFMVILVLLILGATSKKKKLNIVQ